MLSKVDKTADYKDNNKRFKILFAIITILVLLVIVLSYKLGYIGYSPLTFSEVDNISLREENAIINHGARLNIFGANKVDKSKVVDGFRVIYPSIKGEYKFSIKNETLTTMKYDIDFKEKMTAPINMKYRVKMDNIYIKGSQDKYLDLSDINVKDIVVPSNSINVYTLEWCWVEDDVKDTKVANAQGNQYYEIGMTISSAPYVN